MIRERKGEKRLVRKGQDLGEKSKGESGKYVRQNKGTGMKR